MATFRYASMSRRAALTAAALAAMATVAGCTAKSGGEAKGDMALGAGADAKVTVVEYASVTCGHCAVWNEEVWPEFKTKYVDTKKVRYVFREFPTPPQDIAVAGFLIARCAGEDKYFDVMHDIMASQKEWAAAAVRNRVVRGGTPACHSFWLAMMSCMTSKYLSSPAQRAIRKPATAMSCGGVGNSRNT